MRIGPIVGVLALLSAASGQAPTSKPTPANAARSLGSLGSLDHKSFDRYRAAILPAADEEKWRRIGWHAQFRAAVREADRLDKPILLWAMNGHPLGCV